MVSVLTNIAGLKSERLRQLALNGEIPLIRYCGPGLMGLGITALVLSQALINFAVVLGMVPTKGIPLPFVSYGGSSLLVMLLATGVLLNISQQATET